MIWELKEYRAGVSNLVLIDWLEEILPTWNDHYGRQEGVSREREGSMLLGRWTGLGEGLGKEKEDGMARPVPDGWGTGATEESGGVTLRGSQGPHQEGSWRLVRYSQGYLRS